MAGLKCISVIFLLSVISYINGNLVVEVDVGKVAGVEVDSILKDEKYFSFMGIPYGKAPVGPLRFMAPEPRDSWSEVLNAKKEKQPCTQFNLPIRSIKNYGVFGQDDCLHLSIHTPKLPSDNEAVNLPVVVFLYNEYFRISYNASDDYGPDFFMKEDVILVTVSHRLGAAGFLGFDDDLLPGNNGIRDVILALKWLQRNIGKFGGDKGSLTLMGVEGGAVITDILLQSPKAKGLFSKVIMQSDTSWQSLYFPKSSKAKAKALANYLDKSSVTSLTLLKELSTLSSAKIALAEPESVDADEGRLLQRSTIPFGPTVEHEHPDAVITKLPEDDPINIDIPVMIGYNSREGLELMERYLRKPQYLTFADRDFLLLFPTRDDFRFELHSSVYHHAIQEIKDFYFEEGYVKVGKPGEYMTYISDMMSFYSIDYTVRNYVNESKSPVYYYTFDYSGELNLRKNEILGDAKTIEGTWGATSGDELCYLFVCKAYKEKYVKILEDKDSEELQVIKNVIKMWTNFAKFGNPTPVGSDITWTPATKENKECLIISEELQLKNNLHGERVDFWDNYLAKYKAMAVNGVIKDKKDEL